MTEYVQNLNQLVPYLEKLNDENLLKWVSKFIIHGYTAPLISMPMIQTCSSFISQIFDFSKDFNFKMRFKEIIKKIYRSYPKDKYQDYTFIELLIIIGRLNITSLFPELWRDAWGEIFKNKFIKNYPKSFDLHTVLLKCLFGISPEGKNVPDLTMIIRRDIFNPKYMLECFETLYLLPKNISNAIYYIPLLLEQIPSNKRDFEGTLCDFINTLGINNLKRYVADILKSIMHDDNLIESLSNVFHMLNIDTLYNYPDFYISCNNKNNLYKVKLEGSNRAFNILYRKLSEKYMRRICNMEQKDIIEDIFPLNTVAVKLR